MPFRTKNTGTAPEENSLIVCAGTVTCNSVAEMGSGFMVFKRLFSQGTHYDNSSLSWQQALDQSLSQYNMGKKDMPFYQRIARQGSYIGGVATVPVFSHKGLMLKNELSQEEQYKKAVSEAVADALKLRCPLYIQPLGIGVYGWTPKTAAKLFVEAICKADPDDEVILTIPIHNQERESRDQIFQELFNKEMRERKRQPYNPEAVATVTPPKPMQEVTLTPLEEIKEELMHPPADHKQALIQIIDTLIDNIEQKKSSRWTSGKNSQKVKLLRDLRDQLQEKPELIAESEEEIAIVRNLQHLCAQKRNSWHFWATPDSVKELRELLNNNAINLPPQESENLNSKI